MTLFERVKNKCPLGDLSVYEVCCCCGTILHIERPPEEYLCPHCKSYKFKRGRSVVRNQIKANLKKAEEGRLNVFDPNG